MDINFIVRPTVQFNACRHFYDAYEENKVITPKMCNVRASCELCLIFPIENMLKGTHGRFKHFLAIKRH